MLFVRVVELLVLVVWLLSLSNYNLFSKIKAFGDFSESLFTLQNNSKMLCGSNMVLKDNFFMFNMIILKKYVIGIWQKNDRNMAETRQKHDSEN